MKRSLPNSRCSYYHETHYQGNFWMDYREFKPEDVMSYYDIFDDGTVYIYIKEKKRFLWWTWDKIWVKSTDEIDIRETPVRRVCYE